MFLIAKIFKICDFIHMYKLQITYLHHREFSIVIINSSIQLHFSCVRFYLSWIPTYFKALSSFCILFYLSIYLSIYLSMFFFFRGAWGGWRASHSIGLQGLRAVRASGCASPRASREKCRLQKI